MTTAGRPKDHERTHRILHATREILADRGYDLLSMDAVADRAGVSKPTIYRRWASRADLVTAAIRDLAPHSEVPDTGSVQDDLRLALSGLPNMDVSTTRLVLAVASALPRDPDLAAVLRERVINPRIGMLQDVLTRAVERHELPGDTDVDFLATVIPSMLGMRYVLTGVEVDQHYTATLIEQFLGPLGFKAPPAADVAAGSHLVDRSQT